MQLRSRCDIVEAYRPVDSTALVKIHPSVLLPDPSALPLRPIASHVIFYEACYSGREAEFARDPAGIGASSGSGRGRVALFV